MTNPTQKLPMHTPSLSDEKFAALAALFPNAVTETITGYEDILDEKGEPIKDIEGNVKRRAIVERAVAPAVLEQEINTHVLSGKEERYQFTWPDKRKSVLLANAPINAALRPCREESVDFDNTENLYIEGDNLDVLKLLRETYLNKVKMIYIDPPYNTSNDFIYNDDFSEDTESFLSRDGQYDDQDNRLVKNLDSNGRFHTDWLNMIYPRLRIARDLLMEDGVIFISCDDNEVENLKKICNEIFGENNFRNAIITRRYDKNLNRQFMEQGLTTMNIGFEYILMYAKNTSTTFNPVFRASSEERSNFGYWKGFWNDANRPTMRYNVLDVTPESGQWKWKKEIADEAVQNYIKYRDEFSDKMTLEEYWISTGKTKRFIRRNLNGKGQNKGVEHWVAPADGVLRNTNWTDLLASKPTGFDTPFDSPKNIDVISELIRLSNVSDDGIILDFFSGSATTAHAVMQLNAEDGGKRKFILVQIPEECKEDSEAFKAGYKNICEIGKERIRRAGINIKKELRIDAPFKITGGDGVWVDQYEQQSIELADSLDIGFRVLKLDSSNMKDVYYTPDEYAELQFNITGFADNIKEGREDEDLLFQVMLDLGIPLSAKIKQDGDVFNVNEDYLIACFKKVDTAKITEIAKQKPYYAVFRDSSFESDSAMVNFEQIFKTYSPDTIRRVL